MKAASLCDSSPFHSHRMCHGKSFCAVASTSAGELPVLGAIGYPQRPVGQGRRMTLPYGCAGVCASASHVLKGCPWHMAPSRSQALGAESPRICEYAVVSQCDRHRTSTAAEAAPHRRFEPSPSQSVCCMTSSMANCFYGEVALASHATPTHEDTLLRKAAKK